MSYDLMGGYEIGEDPIDEILMGEDDDYYLGEDYYLGAMPKRFRGRRRSSRGRALRARMAASHAARTATKVVETVPSKARTSTLGFDSAANIAADATTTQTTRPQVTFRLERLVIPQAIAPNFLITDVRVGKNSQFLNGNAVPGEVFASNAVGVGLKGDTCPTGNDVIINATNISAGAVRFFGAFIGTSVE